MGEKTITSVVVVLTAVIGVAIVAVLVSRQSDTANVLGAGGKAFANILSAAVAPVTGGGGGGGLGGSTGLGGYFNQFGLG